MLQIRLVAFIFLWALASPALCNPFQALRKSVFKIRAQSQDPNYLIPWQKESTKSGSGTGFYIGGNRIMTNAHVVANAQFVTVQRDGDSLKQSAKVEFIAHDCDLAVLVVEDKEYLKKVRPMSFGRLPKLRTPVATIGYPTGGDQVSITEGVVSRIDFRRYAHSGYNEHLLIQVDSAINPGNSGGPVVQGRKVVGVAFQSYTAAENTGYIIPTVIVKRFLRDIEDGQYDGHPVNEVTVFPEVLSNPALRQYLGHRAESGVLVTKVPKFSPFYSKFKSNDIVISVDGIEIGTDGKVLYQDERVNFETIYDLKLKGEKTNFELLRDKKVLQVSVEAAKGKPHYHQGDVFHPFPRFYVYGGFVFTALSRNYIKSWGSKWYYKAPLHLRFAHYYGTLDEKLSEKEEFIVLSKQLNAPLNQYIFIAPFQIVDTVNDKKVRSLQDLKEKIEKNTQSFVDIAFLYNQNKIVLPAEITEQGKAIAKHYGVEPQEWLGEKDRDVTTEWKRK